VDLAEHLRLGGERDGLHEGREELWDVHVVPNELTALHRIKLYTPKSLIDKYIFCK